MKNSKQTLVFNFNNAVINEHVYDDDDESSEVIIGKNDEHKTHITIWNWAHTAAC